ncbi:MAG: hypothetical protein B6I20_12025 [Bacteroidetes bacterium 4572_117]|nr:MAG: hypothetical protein B6I20_12025 [Bacteroidetes bacterium 4572_117]
MKHIYLTILLLLTAQIFISAQDGTIRGKIFDRNTGEEIIGATIVIEGTSPLIGAVSDFDGNFSLENIPEGKLDIKCSFISYETKIVKGILLAPNDVKLIDFSLNQHTEAIKEVVASASAIRNTENSLQTIQKKSASFVNGISSQHISRLGDSDASSALKRVSGVSIGNGKYVFVRGLSDRYSKVTLNGAEIPGLDPNKNTVQMDIFPSNIIDNIIVHKTFTPELPASFAGGYVNVATKSFPTKFTLQFSTSFGYNPNANLRDDFISYKGGKLDALGIDDGTRAIPGLATGGIPFLYENNDKLDNISSSFNKIMGTSDKTSFLNHSHSFSVGNQVKLFDKPLGFIFSSSYSRNFKYYDDGTYSKYSLVNTSGNAGTMNPLIIETERNGEEEILMSFLLGASYKLSDNSKIGVTLLRNTSGLIAAKNREGNKIEDDIYMYENTLGFQERSLNSIQLNGKHIINAKKDLELEWISSYTLSKQSEPDLRFFNYDNDGASFQISPNAYPAPARFYRHMDEKNIDNKLHFTKAVKIFGNNAKIKFGGAYTYKSRNSDSRKFDILSQQLGFNGNIEDYLSDGNIGQESQDATYGFYYQNDPLTDDYNSYNASESLVAAYAMLDLPLGKKIRIVLGARYEYDYTFIENNVEPSHHKRVMAEHIYPMDILPAVNLKYSLSKSMNIRLAYSGTLARPSFREIAPYAYYDFKEGWRVVGEPDLQRTLINNTDLRWEYFMQKGQIVSVSLFHKYFNKPIELIDDPRANNPEFHYVNVENSSLYGVEVEIRKRLVFFGLENLLIGGNFTLLKSEVEVVEDYGIENRNVITRRPMYGQAPWVVNSFVTYENKDIKFSSSMAFNVTGKKLAVVTKGETPNIYSQPVPNMNFNISKGLGKRFIAKFAIKNILNNDYKKTYTYDNQKYIFQSHKLGRTYSLGISYLLK